MRRKKIVLFLTITAQSNITYPNLFRFTSLGVLTTNSGVTSFEVGSTSSKTTISPTTGVSTPAVTGVTAMFTGSVSVGTPSSTVGAGGSFELPMLNSAGTQLVGASMKMTINNSTAGSESASARTYALEGGVPVLVADSDALVSIPFILNGQTGDSTWVVCPQRIVMTGVSIMALQAFEGGVSIFHATGAIPSTTNGQNGLINANSNGTGVSIYSLSGTTVVPAGDVLLAQLKGIATAGVSQVQVIIWGRKRL
jgi:hypothetical protein